MKTEYLIQFPASTSDLGTMPAHLMLAKGEWERREAIKAGGRDISADAGAWAEYERYEREEWECRV